MKLDDTEPSLSANSVAYFNGYFRSFTEQKCPTPVELKALMVKALEEMHGEVSPTQYNSRIL